MGLGIASIFASGFLFSERLLGFVNALNVGYDGAFIYLITLPIYVFIPFYFGIRRIKKYGRHEEDIANGKFGEMSSLPARRSLFRGNRN